MDFRRECNYIVKSSISRVLPDEAVKRALSGRKFSDGRLLLVSVGKAAWSMANAAYEMLGQEISEGIVITKHGYSQGNIGNLRIFEAGHPVPDDDTFSATAEVLGMTENLSKNDTVVFLLSGGGSSLFEAPRISAEELQSITSQLLASGADIVEIDLKMTKDSVLVLSHDRTLNRCTSGKGPVSDCTYEDILKYTLKRGHGIATDTLHMPTLRQALMVCKDRICVNIDQGYEFYEQILEITEELGVTGQILIKGNKAIDVVAAHEAAHEHNMVYMPIVNINSQKGLALLESYLQTHTVPVAFEVCWQDDATFDEASRKIRELGSRVWVNTIWASLCGGLDNDDDAAFATGDVDGVYGRLLSRGASMFQTDRPQTLIPYLESIGRHTLK